MFLLIERDPFVRTDMCLTLVEAFPEVDVVSVDSILAGQAATQERPGLLRPRLVLFDGVPDDPAALVLFDIWRRDQTPVLLTDVSWPDAETNAARVTGTGTGTGTGTEPCQQSTPGNSGPPFLSRPFTTEMLLRAVQAAMRTMA